MDIYENIIIGNFLFGLGLRMGMSAATGAIQPLSVNLLQQTPLDTPLADVVLSSRTLYRIIEFKRSANTSEKELLKCSNLSQIVENDPEARDLSNLSRRVHWYVRSDFRRDSQDIDVIPYLDFSNLDVPKRDFARLGVLKFDDFIENTAKEAVSQQAGADEMRLYERYLRLLESCGSRNTGKTGCLLVAVRDGRMSFAAVENVRDLFRTPMEIIRTLDRQTEQRRDFEGPEQRRDFEGPEQRRDFEGPEQRRDFEGPEQRRDFGRPEQRRDFGRPEQRRDFGRPERGLELEREL
jgi:hypothetical protein